MINDEAVDMTWKLDYLEIFSLIVDNQSNTLLNKMSQLQFF